MRSGYTALVRLAALITLRAAFIHDRPITFRTTVTMEERHKFSARFVLAAGLHGLMTLPPQYFLEDMP